MEARKARKNFNCISKNVFFNTLVQTLHTMHNTQSQHANEHRSCETYKIKSRNHCVTIIIYLNISIIVQLLLDTCSNLSSACIARLSESVCIQLIIWMNLPGRHFKFCQVLRIFSRFSWKWYLKLESWCLKISLRENVSFV